MKQLRGELLTTDDVILANFTLVSKSKTEAIVNLEPGSLSKKNIKTGKFVNLKIVEFDGINLYTGKVSHFTSNTLRLKKLQLKNHAEKRMNVKIFMNFFTYIIHNYNNEEQLPVRRKIYVNLTDLSAGGLCFNSSIDFPVEDNYEFIFDRGTQPVVVKFDILRKDTTPAGGFTYGCRFIDISEEEERIIRAFVFKKQIK